MFEVLSNAGLLWLLYTITSNEPHWPVKAAGRKCVKPEILNDKRKNVAVVPERPLSWIKISTATQEYWRHDAESVAFIFYEQKSDMKLRWMKTVQPQPPYREVCVFCLSFIIHDMLEGCPSTRIGMLCVDRQPNLTFDPVPHSQRWVRLWFRAVLRVDVLGRHLQPQLMCCLHLLG